MLTFEELKTQPHHSVIFLEPRTMFDSAIIGITDGMDGCRVAYDRDLIVQILVEENNWNADEAEDWFEYHIAGAYLGQNTPIFIELFDAQPG